jgi:hypothetical protein
MKERAMTVMVSCPRCEAVIDAVDEDDLVAKVQAHVRVDQDLDHAVRRKHIRARQRLGDRVD